MKQLSCIALFASLASMTASAQVTITSADMFNQTGLYYRAYSNPFDPTALSPTPYPTGNVQGSAGANQVWDFSTGPTNVIYRFDYLSPTNIDPTISTNFPMAKIVEQKTDEATANSEYLFFEQVPGVGRQVYGTYAENSLTDPANVFQTPIVDFPDEITFGQSWTTVAVYVNNVGGADPTDPSSGGFSIATQITQTSDLKADAWGTVNLPGNLGFGPALRINESVTIDIAVDDGSGNFQHADTEYAKNFYWLMPGRGMVAAIASTQGSSPPPDNFSTCTQFWRMFETNKKPSTSTNNCVNPDPVSDLAIKVANGLVRLTWSKANCAKTYRVDYSTTPGDQTSWKTLTTVTNAVLAFDSLGTDTSRFYRIVSMK